VRSAGWFRTILRVAANVVIVGPKMQKFFAPNLKVEGRVVRGITAFIFSIGAVITLRLSRRLSLLLFLSALFTLYEASRGWCVVRACGIRTKV